MIPSVRRRVASASTLCDEAAPHNLEGQVKSESVVQRPLSPFSLIPLTPNLDSCQDSRTPFPRYMSPSNTMVGGINNRSTGASVTESKVPTTILERTDSEATLHDGDPAPFRKWINSPSEHRHHYHGFKGYRVPFTRSVGGRHFTHATRWTMSKWCLALSVASVFVYGTAALVCALLTWFRSWRLAGIMLIADNDVLILITIAGSITLLTALTGMVGTMLNSRPLLAVYVVLLWSALVAIFVVGRISYRRATFALDRKLNLSWSRYYTTLGRLLIQSTLQCCGYYSPLHEATLSETCNPSTALPGCKGSLFRFEQENLRLVWTAALSLVPLHTVNIVVGLLCANHVTVPRILDRGRGMGCVDLEETQALLHGTEFVQRPQMSRAASSRIFREDRKN